MMREPNELDENPQIVQLQQYNKQMQDTIKDLSIQLERGKSLLKEQTERNRLLEDVRMNHRGQLEKIHQEKKELLLRYCIGRIFLRINLRSLSILSRLSPVRPYL